jgi:hypothetical protein
VREGRHTGVASLASQAHEDVLAQGAGLVVRGLEDGCAAHGRLGSGDDGKVLASDAEKHVPAVWSVQCGE